MKHISDETIKEQWKEDLIGKDAYRGTSLTYAFLANQFGHFSPLSRRVFANGNHKL